MIRWLLNRSKQSTRNRLLSALIYGSAGYVAISIFGSCSNPVGPPPVEASPKPTPSPSATPGPTEPFPSVIINGRWEPPLHGAVICCASGGPVDEGLRDGWELINEPAAKKFADHGVNVTHIRTGPYAGQDYSRLRPTVEMLGRLRIHVETTLIDGWVLRHGLSMWGEDCSIMSRAPRAHHVQHIQTVVRETLAPHVFYEVGNEASLCRPSRDWYEGVVNAAKAAGAQIVGGDEDYEFLDYKVVHGFRLPIPIDKPVHLNESDNEYHAPAEWLSLFQNAEEVGGTVYFWAGPLNDTDRNETLRLLKEWLDAGKPRANACNMPAECPTLTKWGGHEHICEGDTCLLDSTPKFTSLRRPINEEHNAVGSCTGEDEPAISAAWRRCEPPTGPKWDGIIRVASNVFQAKARVGSRVRICPPDEPRDYFGQPVAVGEDPCTEFVVEYR